jgi:uncharacterized protein with HEPN domain
MVEAAETAARFIAGRTRAELDGDVMLLFALVRAVEIVGEAAAKVTPATRAALPGVTWPLIVGMRNRLVHAYFDTDRGILWTTVTQALPALLPALAAVLEEGQADG